MSLSEFLAKSLIPRAEAEHLLAHVLGCERQSLLFKKEEEIAEEQKEKFFSLVEQRRHGCPVAYLLGKKGFYKEEFFVDANVLIPRPETELLVEEVIKCFPLDCPLRIADLGTGSGCLGLSLAKEYRQSEVWLIDVSPGAIQVATKNRKQLGLKDRVHLCQCDVQEMNTSLGPFDVVVANPPYIAKNTTDLAEDVRKYEPHIALFAGEEGVEYIYSWSAVALQVLKEKGLFLCEIGFDQGGRVFNKFTSTEMWRDVSIIKDYSGHDRVLKAFKGTKING